MHTLRNPERHAIDIPQFQWPSSSTPLTGSDISMPDVVPPTPPLEDGESHAGVSVRVPGEDYGFPEVIEEVTAYSFLKPSSPFDVNSDAARDAIVSMVVPNRSRRKALLIGIKYDGVTAPVEGSHDDVEDMKCFLLDHQGWKEDEVIILKDDGASPQQPTRDIMLDRMHDLVRDARAGDELFFHFAGHGGQTADLDGDEADGMDEVIYSCDKKQIVDDELHDILVKPLPTGCRLTALFDCCSSGTGLDLPVVASLQSLERLPPLVIPSGGSISELDAVVSPARDGTMLDLPHNYNHAPLSLPPDQNAPSESPAPPKSLTSPNEAPPAQLMFHRKHSAGDVIMWSSCQDWERSHQVVASKDSRMKGAMTHAFIECLKDQKRWTYQGLLNALNETLDLWNCPQKPMMSSAHHINMHDIFSL